MPPALLRAQSSGSCPLSPRETGQVLHVLVEGRRREFQDFNRRQIGNDHLAELLDGHALIAIAADWSLVVVTSSVAVTLEFGSIL